MKLSFLYMFFKCLGKNVSKIYVLGPKWTLSEKYRVKLLLVAIPGASHYSIQAVFSSIFGAKLQGCQLIRKFIYKWMYP